MTKTGATRKELQVWLDQFPEDATIDVITTDEHSSGYESFTHVYETELDLSYPIDPEFGTFAPTFEIERAYDIKKGTNKVIVIRLGVKK